MKNASSEELLLAEEGAESTNSAPQESTCSVLLKKIVLVNASTISVKLFRSASIYQPVPISLLFPPVTEEEDCIGRG